MMCYWSNNKWDIPYLTSTEVDRIRLLRSKVAPQWKFLIPLELCHPSSTVDASNKLIYLNFPKFIAFVMARFFCC